MLMAWERKRPKPKPAPATPDPAAPKVTSGGGYVCAWCGKKLSGALWKRYCNDKCKMKAYRARKKRQDSSTYN